MFGAIIDVRNPHHSDIPVYQSFPETNSEFVQDIMLSVSCGFVVEKVSF